MKRSAMSEPDGAFMRLTTFTDYCLRVLIHVGAKDGQLSTIDEIAEGYGISRNHLMKVVARLAQLGFLSTVRGKKGGMRLATNPATIRIGSVVRATEEDLSLVDCFQAGGGNCRIEPACKLKHALGEALEAFLHVLDGYTLADLVEPRSQLLALLHLPSSADALGAVR